MLPFLSSGAGHRAEWPVLISSHEAGGSQWRVALPSQGRLAADAVACPVSKLAGILQCCNSGEHVWRLKENDGCNRHGSSDPFELQLQLSWLHFYWLVSVMLIVPRWLILPLRTSWWLTFIMVFLYLFLHQLYTRLDSISFTFLHLF